jgi:GIY-YIG catalytic domain
MALNCDAANHYTGNAEGSTLRKTLGCLLANELGIQLWRVGSGNRMTFIEGEQALSAGWQRTPT